MEPRDYVDTAAALEHYTVDQLITLAKRLDPGLEDRDFADAGRQALTWGWLSLSDRGLVCGGRLSASGLSHYAVGPAASSSRTGRSELRRPCWQVAPQVRGAVT
jgi:hypothetical protein